MLVDSQRPESIHTWMQGKKAKELLTLIGNRELELTHQAFDSLPRSTALEHLRAILIHNRLIEIPENRYLRMFEHWLETRLRELSPYPEVAVTIEQFARWHHLKRLRANAADAKKNMDISTRVARQEITEAGKFLLWLLHEHAVAPAAMTQWHIDIYLDGGTSTRKMIRNFVSWFARGRGGKRALYVPPRYAQTLPALNERQRLQLIRNTIEMDQIALGTRVAALIHLLWATPLTRITLLKAECVELSPTGMTITLGTTPANVPEVVAPMFWAFLSERSNQQTANVGTDWMFPGYRAGQAISSSTLQQRFLKLGIDPQRARNASLKSITAQLDVRSLSELLGYSRITLANHAKGSSAYMSGYVDAKRQARQEGQPVRARFFGS